MTKHPAAIGFVFLAVLVGTAAAQTASSASEASRPHLETRNGIRQLVVDGRRLNGDETGHDRRWPSMRSFGIYRYRVYQRD